MLAISIIPNGEGAWPDLKGKDFINLDSPSPPMQIAFLDMGMASGRPSVAIRIELPDGRTGIMQTSARLFASAGRALMAKYPGLFEGD